MSQVFFCIPFTMVSILLALDSTMRFLLCCLLEQILHISDVEVKDTKLLGNSPIIIVAFQTQQIYCARDRDGNITEGAKDEIHTVHYAWAMQQVIPGEMQEFDIHRRWKLREMQQLGIQALI
jgi:import inner membrane translocase subunit TIM44